MPALDDLDRRILNRLQRGFPVSERPYLEMAQELGIGEEELIARLRSMLAEGTLTRFGPLYQAERLGGAYTLAAMQVREDQYDRIARIVNAYPEVAHNYRREHALNMWFVVAAASPATVSRVLFEIERDCGHPVFEFRKLREYFVALDLPL
ncbi:MAG TPA: AsnC family transcriptional regulator [Burkholderiales bacterium]|nr:AsnC family transcriptional regulator [Burkholderiales bacterium]